MPRCRGQCSAEVEDSDDLCGDCYWEIYGDEQYADVDFNEEGEPE